MVKEFHSTTICVKSVCIGKVDSFRILIRNFDGATTLGHVIVDISSLYE